MAIVNLTRPAIRIDRGSIGELPANWKFLAEHRERIDQAIACVGRLELEGHPFLPWVGVGTIVGPYQFLTARHAAKLFCDGQGDSGLKLKTEFMAYLTGGPSIGTRVRYKLPVTAVHFLHPYFDVALCQLGSGNMDNDNQEDEIGVPIGLTLAAEAPAPLAGRKVAVIGFATADSRNDASEIERVYGNNLSSNLYLQPGEVLGSGRGRSQSSIGHDCSTVGGSAGSPLLDLETGQVLGIHYAGMYLLENFAEPGWDLSRDRRVRSYGIRFSDEPHWMYQWAVAELAASRLSQTTSGEPLKPSTMVRDEPPEPEPDPEIHYFNQNDLYRIRDLLNATGLAREDRQYLLFVSMSTRFIASLPITGSPDARVMNVLNILNQTSPLTSGELPMRTLLFNAVENSKPRYESLKLQAYLDLLPGV